MKAIVAALIALAAMVPLSCLGAVQDKLDLPQPYLDWEKAYLKEYPDLQKLMDNMISTLSSQLKDPDQDILHIRVCSALAYRMAMENKLEGKARRLAVVTDLLHDFSKQDKSAVLSRPEIFAATGQMVARLRQAGHLKASPLFWGDEAVVKNPKVADNLALIHHFTGALSAGEAMKKAGGYAEADIMVVQAGILGHSTGYWYFRDSIDAAAGRADAWKAAFPEPEGEIALFAHDADLISQFVPESVVPAGSKWRSLAKNRWKAAGEKEEAHVVYYVFLRLFEEARTKVGQGMAKEKWEQIRPPLVKLMGLDAAADPVKALGVPKAFQK